MKLDGVTMEAMEPTDAVAEALSPQENTVEQTTSQSQGAATDAAPRTDPKANGEPVAADPQTKPKVNANKAAAKSAGASGSNSRPGAASRRAANDVKASNVSAAPVKKLAVPKSSSAAVGAVPKRPVGVAAVSFGVKKQTREPDKKPVGQTRSTSVAAATVTNGTKPTTVNDTAKKRPGAETVKPKTTAASRPAASCVPKPSTSSTPKAGAATSSKTTRPATAPSTSRPASTASRSLTATAKPSTAATAKTSASRVTTAPSTGRTAATPPLKTAPAKKADVSRPPSAAVAKKPTGATTSAGTKKPESSKPTASVKTSSAPKWSTTTKAADPKVSQPRTQQPVNSAPTKKPVAAVRFPTNNKLPLGRTPPASPSTKAAHSTTSQAKGGIKPTQAVSPFAATKKRGVRNTDVPAVEAQCIADVAVSAPTATASAATPTAVRAEEPADVIVSTPHESSRAASVSEDVTLSVVSQAVTPDVVIEETTQTHEAPSSPSQSPPRSDLPETSEQQEHVESSVSSLTKEEQMLAAAEPTIPAVAPPPDFSEEPVLKDQTSSTLKALEAAANAIPQKVPHTDVNEDEDEDEREGSQLVSVSEMSGTTQPTEESRPDSVGPVGGSAWRAGGALLSELDSEEVSGSQQGASELSAPGVLEGTESMDDLGDGSLKGAIDTEGASAGSPDFEKVPDIPVNDFDEDEDEDDDDRVCDMDVGSERADEPQRPRHDNDVDDEEDEDVEMASEGVTESGLESYGNADEDDFAEDERLDNLNRVAQPPPPPLLPSAPAAQWDQPNPFVDPWAEPLQLVHMEGAAAAGPSVDHWQANTETPIQTKAWLELGSSPFASDNQEVTHHSSARDKPQNLDTQIYMDESNAAPSPAPVLLSAPGMSLSSTLSSETSTPEEQIQDMHAIVSPKLDLTSQDPDMEGQDGGEEEEAETLPADEVLGDPATAPTSNPSSSESEDEPSDTEGEVRLDDSVESPLIAHVTFDKQSSAQRCLSTVEEGEEAEMEECQSGAAEDTTPPSATSLASYGFDTMTTTSNSNAHSTGESCIKSPGIFSLEELPEEPKEVNVSQQPHVQPSLLEQQYIECGKQEDVSAEDVREQVPGPEETLDPSSPGPLHRAEEIPDDIQPPYYSAICEKTENSFAGFTALPHPHRRDHAAHPRTYCDIVKPHGATANPPKLTCADLPPRSFGQQELSPQLRRLEQHQRQLLELQQRREQQNRPLEEAEQERKAREEEEQRKKEEEAGEEIKRNKEEVKAQEQVEMTEEEVKQRRDLELQLQQQQEELKQRQQIMQWQQELQQVNKGQTALLSPSSGLCTIYEALENSDEEGGTDEKEPGQITPSSESPERSENVISEEDKHHESSPSSEGLLPTLPDSPESPSDPSQEADSSSPCPPESPERPSPLDLDWGKKVDIVQQLINQTLLLNREGCSSMLLLPGGAGGTLSPLESSLWPSLLPPLTPPSATVTSVSSFSPEATGSSPQGEWTVVELETHH